MVKVPRFIKEPISWFLVGSNTGSAALWKGISLLKKDPKLLERVQLVYKIGMKSAAHSYQDAIDSREGNSDDAEDDAYFSSLPYVFGGLFIGEVCALSLAPFYFAGELLYNWKKDNLRPPKTPLEETAERLTEKPGTAKPGDDLLLQYAQP